MKARRLIAGSLFSIVVLLAILAFFAIATRRPQLELGVGYAARVACGCHYIGGRTLADCHKDFEPGMEPIRLAEDMASRTVTASVPLIASRSVRYDPVLGCRAEPYRGTALVVKH